MRQQGGYALLLVLIFLAVGALAIVPSLNFLYSTIVGQGVAEDYLDEQYAADAALEDAYWQIMNDNLLDNLDWENETYTYEYNFQPDFFAGDIPVTLSYADAPPSDWVGDFENRMRIKSLVDPAWSEEASGTPQYFDYVLLVHNQFFGIGNESDQDDISILIPAALQAVPGSSEDTVPAQFDPDNEAEWPSFSAHTDPVEVLVDGQTWQDGDTTWDEIASSTDTRVVDVLGDEKVTLDDNSSVSLAFTYDFVGTTTANQGASGYPIAIEYESRIFPWTAANQQKTTTYPTDADYVNISADNTAEWASLDYGNQDEVAITNRFFILEDVSTITNIEITWNGNTDGSAASNHSIWVRKDGFDEFGGTDTWVQLGSSLSMTSGVDTDLIRSLTSDFGTYVNGSTGQFEFVVTTETNNEIMRTNFIQIEVSYDQPVFSTPGEIVSNSITFPDLSTWYQLIFNDNEPALTDIYYQVEYFNGFTWQLVPDIDLANNSTGFGASPVSLTNMDVGTYDEIRLKATLSTTDNYITPEIYDWQIEVMDSDAKRKLTWYYDPALAIGGRDVYLLKFQVFGNPTWGLHYAQPSATFRPSGGIITGPTGPLSVAIYHVTIKAGTKTIKAVIAYTEAGAIKIASYQIS